MKKQVDISSFQKRIYRYMRRKALSYEGGVSKELKSYRNSQQRYANREFEIADLDELLTSIDDSKVIYLGDFHTFDQSSKNLQRLFRALTKKKNKITLGVEFVHHQHQEIIQQYLDHHITELEFLESINYHDSWRFPWAHYKVLFDIAKKNKFKVVALNSRGTLKKRDQFAANLIQEQLEEFPKSKMLILFGEYHIISNKLPAEVKKVSNKKFNHTIIHQNLDPVFWKLQEENLTNHHVVKFNDNEYSLQTSSPWVKYESMIYWYENLCEDPEFDIHEYMIETGVMTLNSNVPENFKYLCEEISKNLNIEVSKDDIEDFNLYDHQSISTILDKIENIPNKSIASFYRELLLQGRSFNLPNSNSFYCSNYSINRLSFLAGIHIHNLTLKKSDNFKSALKKRNHKERFLFYLYRLTMAYFSSKIINPYRKCNLYQDLYRIRMHIPKETQERDRLDLLFELFKSYDQDDIDLDELLKGHSLLNIYFMAKSLGYFMGDVLYDNHYKKGTKAFSKILEILSSAQYDESSFDKILRKLLPQKKYKNFKKRFF